MCARTIQTHMLRNHSSTTFFSRCRGFDLLRFPVLAQSDAACMLDPTVIAVFAAHECCRWRSIDRDR